MQQPVEKVFFALIRFEINGDELCDNLKKSITEEMLPELFRFSKHHDLAHLIGDALDKNNLFVDSTDIKKRFLQERDIAVYRYLQQQYELDQICDTLEKEKISFIPLKGSVIRQYYPEPWMRTSCDIDILVKEENFAVAIDVLKEKLQYSVRDKAGLHDISLFAPSGVHLELHFTLKENHENLDVGLKEVWNYVVQIDNYKFRYNQTNEFLFFHLIAHAAYHLIVGGGCGLRNIVDIWLMHSAMQYSESELIELCDIAGLSVFYYKILGLSQCCMSGIELNTEEKILFEFIADANMYGDVHNRAAIRQVKSRGKFLLIISRIFISYKEMLIYYPNLKKHKILFPFYQVLRWGRLLFGANSKNFKREVISTISSGQEQQEKVKEILQILGM